MTLNGDQKFLALKDALNDDFFIEIVERELETSRNKFKLNVLSIEPATESNQNFVATVCRVKLGVKMVESKSEKTLSFIIKAVLERNDLTIEYDVFDREVLMYENLIDNFEKIWKNATGQEAKFGPKIFKVETQPFQVIVLEDLCAVGFETPNKKIGLNLEHAKLVMSKLAKFHAASAIQFEAVGSVSDKLDRSLLFTPNKPSKFEDQRVNFFKNLFGLLIEAANSLGYQQIAEKISRWDFFKILMSWFSVSEPMSCGFQVLNHGDAWCSNMMFKNDWDVRFIDYQISHWGSPCGDLRFFFISSLADDIKVEHFDDLMLFYHEELVKNLKLLNYQKRVPTLMELHVDMLEKGSGLAFGLMLVLFLAKFDLNDDLDIKKIVDPEKVSVDDLRVMFMSEANLKALKILLPFLNARGFLDALLVEAPNTPLMTELYEKFKQAQIEKAQGSKGDERKIEANPERVDMREI